MSTISASAVNELRKLTDQPLMDCKRALTEAEGDIDKAVVILRLRGKGVTAKRDGNETAEGRVGVSIDVPAGVAAIVEFRCESAPTAKNDRVLSLVDDLAKAVIATGPTDVTDLLTKPFGDATVGDRLTDVVSVIREKMIVQRFARLDGGIFGQYVHHDGSVGALFQCSGTGSHDELLRDVCAHIAALNPPYMVTTDVPTEVIAKERAFLVQQIQDDPKNVGKPANIFEKIAEGKVKSWLSETVLFEQPMANAAKYPGTTVGAALTKAGLKPTKFVRYKVGAVA